jgi:glutaredoxin 3
MKLIFILYGINNCSYCTKSKQLLDDMGIYYEYFEIKAEEKSIFLNNMANETNNQRTFPLIFHNSTFIGGFSELEEYLAFY